jgi:hypothetical protein
MEFYSGIKKNEILSFAGKWVELENIILSEVRLRKTKSTCFLSYVGDRYNTNRSNIMKIRLYLWEVTYERGSVREGS